MNVNETTPQVIDLAQQARDEASVFLENNQLLVQSLMGVSGVKIGVGSKFLTNMETGEVTIDPSFFVGEDYKPEWCMYGTLHEIRAHVSEFVCYPELTKEKNKIYMSGEEYSLFMNIFDDIVGNNDIHQLLPSTKDVAKDVYKNKLFVENDLTEDPMHVQFLYSIIREAMIGDGDSEVDTEVQKSIDGLKRFGKKQEDAIDYVCNPNIDPEKRLKVLKKVVLPVYEELLKKDIEQKKNQQQNEQKGGNQNTDTNQPGNPAEPAEPPNAPGDNNPSKQDGSGGSDGKKQDENKPHDNPQHSHGKSAKPTEAGDMFNESYKKYWDLHPESLTKEQEDELKEHIKEKIKDGTASVIKKDAESKKTNVEKPTNINDQDPGFEIENFSISALETLAGAPYEVIKEYRDKLVEIWPVVEELEEFFDLIIGERITSSYRQQRYIDEGNIDTEQLAEIVARVMSGDEIGSSYIDIREETLVAPASGGFDFHLLIDTSGSMAGEPSELARDAVLGITEGLASCQKKVIETQSKFGVELGMDVATSVVLFDSDLRLVKSTGGNLSESERMKIFQETTSTRGTTQDFLALELVHDEIRQMQQLESSDRQNVVVVVTDGVSDKYDRAERAVSNLRALPNTVVIGIGIDSTAANKLYAPSGQELKDITKLPDLLVNIVKDQINNGLLRTKTTQ